MANGFNEFLMSKNGDLLRAGLAEMLGTAILIVFACGAVVSMVIDIFRCGQTIVTLGIALAFGLTVMSLAAGIGHISGCHVNPAVTIGLLVNGKTDPIRGAVYIIAQMVGAVVGAALLAGILPLGAATLGVTDLSTGVTPMQGIIIEIIITFLLVFVVCNACDSSLAPILIGLTVTAGHIFAVPLTGSSMNTARSFGPALIQAKWDHHYVYWLGPLIGGALAGLIHRLLFMDKTQTGDRMPSKRSGATVSAKADDVSNL